MTVDEIWALYLLYTQFSLLQLTATLLVFQRNIVPSLQPK